MSESEQTVSGSNGQPSAPTTPEQAPGAPKLVTLDEAQRMIDAAVEQAVSRSQSKTDKEATRLQAQVQALQGEIKKLVDSGAEVPAELATSLAQVQAQTQNANANAQMQPYIRQQVDEIVQRYGVDLQPGDGFYEKVNADKSIPAWKFLASLEEQVAAKAESVGNQTQPQRQAQQQTQPNLAYVPSGGSGARQPVGGDLRAQYDKEVQKLRPGSEAVRQLRRAYRAKGLDI